MGAGQVGLKYGNRWLRRITDEEDYFLKVEESTFEDFLDLLINFIRNGDFDEQIEAIRKASAEARAKKA